MNGNWRVSDQVEGNFGIGMNLGILLPGSDRSGQSRFLSLSSGSIEQVSLALFSLFLSGGGMRSLVFLFDDSRTEFARYPVKRIVESNSRWQTNLAKDLNTACLHAPSPRNPLYTR